MADPHRFKLRRPDDAVMLPVSRLLRYNPLGRPFWTDRAVSEEMVRRAVDDGRLRREPIPNCSQDYDDPEAHAERIAWYVVHGLAPYDRIQIDVGAPSLGCYVRNPVQDGNHRLAAAILRGETFLWCSVGGEVAVIKRLFGKAALPREDRPKERCFLRKQEVALFSRQTAGLRNRAAG